MEHSSGSTLTGIREHSSGSPQIIATRHMEPYTCQSVIWSHIVERTYSGAMPFSIPAL